MTLIQMLCGKQTICARKGIVAVFSKEDVAEITEIVFGDETASHTRFDLIFVFGGSNPGVWKTTHTAFETGMAEKILIAGGKNPRGLRHPAWDQGDVDESIGLKNKLVDLGVPDSSILCETKSTNSYENVLFAVELFDFSQVKQIAVICRNHAAGRQCRTLQKFVPESTNIAPITFDSESDKGHRAITRTDWFEHDHGQETVLSELAKIEKYGLAGHLERAIIQRENVRQYVECRLGST